MGDAQVYRRVLPLATRELRMEFSQLDERAAVVGATVSLFETTDRAGGPGG